MKLTLLPHPRAGFLDSETKTQKITL